MAEGAPHGPGLTGRLLLRAGLLVLLPASALDTVLRCPVSRPGEIRARPRGHAAPGHPGRAPRAGPVRGRRVRREAAGARDPRALQADLRRHRGRTVLPPPRRGSPGPRSRTGPGRARRARRARSSPRRVDDHDAARPHGPSPAARSRSAPGRMAGKLGEMAGALRIEARLPKSVILDLYLNALPFGRNARGVGAAAWTYFGRDLASLSEPELLVLAVIPRNPSAYDPFHHPEALAAAARRAADPSCAGGGWPATWTCRPSSRPSPAPGPPGPAAALPTFRGTPWRTRRWPARLLRTGLDPGLTRWIEARIGYRLDEVRASRITNAAAIVLDNATGEVRGWVGSRDFDDAAASGQIDGVLIRRQSASTLKPFLYALALERGWTPATLLPDTGIELRIRGGVQAGELRQAKPRGREAARGPGRVAERPGRLHALAAWAWRTSRRGFALRGLRLSRGQGAGGGPRGCGRERGGVPSRARPRVLDIPARRNPAASRGPEGQR